ncbi:MAG TPA: hypothetical protein VF469_04105 [Kofleriaceae bacterium]
MTLELADAEQLGAHRRLVDPDAAVAGRRTPEATRLRWFKGLLHAGTESRGSCAQAVPHDTTRPAAAGAMVAVAGARQRHASCRSPRELLAAAAKRWPPGIVRISDGID